MRSRLNGMMLVLVFLVGATSATVSTTKPPADSVGAPALFDRQTFHDDMRKLWEDHITWTRLVIVSKLTLPTDLPDLSVTVNRLLQNQVDIGDAIEPFFGTPAANQLTQLLTGHIVTAANILAAAKAGDTTAMNAEIAAWYANAHEIAVFLSTANPRFWPLEEMDQMMKEHLDLTLEEAVARLEGRYADDVRAYDEVHLQILEMADMLSDGIIGLFPSQFSGAKGRR
jgi:hypothetical protein